MNLEEYRKLPKKTMSDNDGLYAIWGKSEDSYFSRDELLDYFLDNEISPPDTMILHCEEIDLPIIDIESQLDSMELSYEFEDALPSWYINEIELLNKKIREKPSSRCYRAIYNLAVECDAEFLSCIKKSIEERTK